MFKVKIKPPKRRHWRQAVSILVNFNLDSETSRSLWILLKFEATPSLNPFSKVIYTKYPLSLKEYLAVEVTYANIFFLPTDKELTEQIEKMRICEWSF